MNWKKFFKTLGRMYSIIYGLVWCIWMVLVIIGYDVPDFKFGQSDIVFALWAFGSALWNAAE